MPLFSRTCIILQECCSNPFVPIKGSIYNWDTAFARNQDLASETSRKPLGLEVLFWGDSIVEGMIGENVGNDVENKADYLTTFQNYFRPLEARNRVGRPYTKGLALGIGGDRIPHLLWRIQNGEMPPVYQPPETKKRRRKQLLWSGTPVEVFWISVGTNDVYDGCSVDALLVGFVNLVLELRKLRPKATIVVNSILPRDQLVFNDQIAGVNEALQCYANLPRSARDSTLNNLVDENGNFLLDDKFKFFDATNIFYKGGDDIERHLMPDGLHPSAEGFEEWFKEIRPQLIKFNHIL